MSKIVVLGSRGMLGHDVLEAFRVRDATPRGSDALDITRPGDVRALLDAERPQLVVNCAAYTAVARAEGEEALATRVNGDGVRNVVAACRAVDASLVHISTDYVFDGRSEHGYDERAVPNPINAYGRSKAAGEAALDDFSRVFLVRTSWLFGHHGHNFVDTIRRLAVQRERFEVVDDQFGCPTYTRDLAAAIVRLVSEADYGTYHLTNEGSCSWCEFATEIVRRCRVECEVVPTSSERYGDPTPRPRMSVLRNTRRPRLRPWREALADYLRVA